MNIALVAHDGRKKELMEWVKYNWETLSQHNLLNNIFHFLVIFKSKI